MMFRKKQFENMVRKTKILLQRFEDCILVTNFCGIFQRQYINEFNMVFQKSCVIFCAKPKEGNPIHSLPNNKILDWSKLKAYADKINVTEKLQFLLGRVENIVGKGENAGYQS